MKAGEKKKKDFIAWDSHRSTWTSEHLTSWDKKYMEKCIIPARHFGNIMKTMISVYCEKLLILCKISAYIPPMICNLIGHVIVSVSYGKRGWPLILFLFLKIFWEILDCWVHFIYKGIFFLLLFYRTEVHLHVNSSRRLPSSLGSQHEPHCNGNLRYLWPSHVHFSKREVTNSSWEFIMLYRKQG